MINQEDKIKLYESLFILYKCQNSTNLIWEKLNQDKSITNGVNYFDSPLLSHIILEVVSFQEEYKSFNSQRLKAYSDRINQIRTINKSLMKKINQWDLLSFRNNIVAHPWRKDGQFILPDSLEYNIPRNKFEFQLLINYLSYSWKMIESEFENEFESAINYIQNIPIKRKPKINYQNINNEQFELVKEVNNKCKELKKDIF
nr:hypothetical protein BACY1_29490 [Tenacibaculum mesophilum]